MSLLLCLLFSKSWIKFFWRKVNNFLRTIHFINIECLLHFRPEGSIINTSSVTLSIHKWKYDTYVGTSTSCANIMILNRSASLSSFKICLMAACVCSNFVPSIEPDLSSTKMISLGPTSNSLPSGAKKWTKKPSPTWTPPANFDN